MNGTPRSSGTPAANAPAIVKIAGRVGHRTCIGNVQWSYSGVPAGGNIIATDGIADRVYTVDIVAAGPGALISGDAWAEFNVGADVTVTLAPGGAGVTGKVSLLWWYKPPL